MAADKYAAQFQVLKLHHKNLDRQLFEQVLLDLLEALIVDLSGLQGAVTELQQSQTAASNELADLAQQVLALQSQGPDNITQADLDNLTTSVHGAATALTGSVSSAQSTVGGGPSPLPAPSPSPSPSPEPAPDAPSVSGVSPSTGSQGDQVVLVGTGLLSLTGVHFGGNTAPNASASDDTSATATVPDGTGSVPVVVDTPAGSSDGSVQFTYAEQPAPTPEPTPSPEPAPGPVVPNQPTKSVYVFDGDFSTLDPSVQQQWPDSGYQTTEDPPRTLYYFLGDSAATDANGDGADNNKWHLYTDEVVPDPATPSPEANAASVEAPTASTPPQG